MYLYLSVMMQMLLCLQKHLKGAAQGHRNVVFLTISTGIGGGMICDGRLLLGTEGLGAEAGHIPMIVEEGKVSSLELEASGPEYREKSPRAYRKW